ncbi:MAG: lipid-A-disaccharide synthase [Planctomycetaceae bacterium]|nr:lipid-A-disaccharide synthase [Planctomycetaceae bacterium]
MRIFFSAGEPSGDQHAAALIHALRKRQPEFQAEGFGGPAMRDSGATLLYELTELAVMGFLRVIPLLARFRQLVKQAEAEFDRNPPDAVVLVDFPGFNWWIAKAAHRRGIPVYYFLPPQLWAWAPWRIRRVQKWVDHVICALPFEYEWYRERGVNATWVGHPFFDEVQEHQLDEPLVAQLRERTPVLGLLPGSRNHEVSRNWPIMIETVLRTLKQCPDVRVVVGNYRQEHADECRRLLEAAGRPFAAEFLVGKTSEVISAADCCLMVSGSISLELLARRTPAVVLYRVGSLPRLASRFLMNCRYITLPNLIADREVMPEFLSSGSPEPAIQQMSALLTGWLTDEDQRQRAWQELDQLAQSAAQTGAVDRTADVLLRKRTPAGADAAVRAA